MLFKPPFTISPFIEDSVLITTKKLNNENAKEGKHKINFFRALVINKFDS